MAFDAWCAPASGVCRRTDSPPSETSNEVPSPVTSTRRGGQSRHTLTNGAAPFALALPDELVEAIAERAAELLADRDAGAGDDGWLRGADRIAAYLDCPRSRVYALASARRIPVHHDGSALIARRSELDRWLRDGGGVRP